MEAILKEKKIHYQGIELRDKAMRMVFIRLGSKIIIIIIISEDYLISGPDGNFSKKHGIYSTHAIRKHNIDEAGVEIQREN